MSALLGCRFVLFFSFVHCSVPTTQNSAWHVVDAQQVLVE